MSGHVRLLRAEIDQLRMPDLAEVADALGGVRCKNGLNETITVPSLLRTFAETMHAAVEAVREGGRLPAEFFVPDWWHVAFGDARSLPRHLGERLWEAGCLANRIGATFYRESLGNAVREGHPGNLYSQPVAVFAEAGL